MKKKTIYNNIKYGLKDLFPTQHPRISIDNDAMSFGYNYIREETGDSVYGEILINKDESVYMWLFKTRPSGDPDVPVFDYTWKNYKEFLGDKDINNIISGLL